MILVTCLLSCSPDFDDNKCGLVKCCSYRHHRTRYVYTPLYHLTDTSIPFIPKYQLHQYTIYTSIPFAPIYHLYLHQCTLYYIVSRPTCTYCSLFYSSIKYSNKLFNCSNCSRQIGHYLCIHTAIKQEKFPQKFRVNHTCFVCSKRCLLAATTEKRPR